MDVSTSSPPVRGRVLLPLLVFMSMLGPLSLNILQPSLPGLVTYFATDRDTAQLTLSLFLGATALSQLLIGPLADRFGRRPVLIVAITVYIAASVAAIFALSIGALITARVAQALGATAGLALGRTIIRDLYDRDKSASMIGYVTMAMVVAPMIAPSLGAVIDDSFGWRAIFIFCTVLGVVSATAVMLRLPETRPLEMAGTDAGTVLRRTLQLAKEPVFLGFAGGGAFGSAIFFVFLGAAPHLVVSVMGLEKTTYGLLFMSLSLGYMVGNFLSGRLSQRIGLRRMIAIGNGLALAGAALLVVFGAMGLMSPLVLFLPCVITSVANGLVLPNAMAGAVSVDVKAAGAASGLTGFCQMGLGAIGTYIGGKLVGESLLPLGLVMAVTAIAGWACSRLTTDKPT
jgi:DHA1 family bicyclomycin/chloramphenicol resistance-like MFS transporter